MGLWVSVRGYGWSSVPASGAGVVLQLRVMLPHPSLQTQQRAPPSSRSEQLGRPSQEEQLVDTTLPAAFLQTSQTLPFSPSLEHVMMSWQMPESGAMGGVPHLMTQRRPRPQSESLEQRL